MNYRWTVAMRIMPVGGKAATVRRITLFAEAENAPDALIAAITRARQDMVRGEYFHMIRCSSAVRAKENQGIAVAWIPTAAGERD